MLPWCHLSVLIGWEDKNISGLRDDEEEKNKSKVVSFGAELQERQSSSQGSGFALPLAAL